MATGYSRGLSLMTDIQILLRFWHGQSVSALARLAPPFDISGYRRGALTSGLSVQVHGSFMGVAHAMFRTDAIPTRYRRECRREYRRSVRCVNPARFQAGTCL